MLVVLRLNIGWHFFSEGVKHYADPSWTSEPVLRNAKGPLAGWYHAYLPDFHGFEELLHGSPANASANVVQTWIDAIGNDWDVDRQRFVEHYGLGEQQQKRAREVFGAYERKLRGWANEQKDALTTHVHQWQRKQAAAQSPGVDVPYAKERVAGKQVSLSAEASGWLAELKQLESEYDTALRNVLNDQQRARPALSRPRTSIDVVDAVMTYVILAIGVLLVLGLLTRLACVAGAVFLFSVVMMQPFWVSETAPTFNQYVEMFALLTLATTQVGRWCGLDFFLHALVAAGPRAAKGPSDVPQS
jgi:uncharacterized membrane protein YphA (DoxX/SURF4 family)